MGDLLVAVVLAAIIFGLGWAFFAALFWGLRRVGAFPVVPVPPYRGPAPGHCPCCGCAIVVVAVCDGGGVSGDC